jgi:hypothetical protein
MSLVVLSTVVDVQLAKVRKRPQLPTNVRSCQERVGSWLFRAGSCQTPVRSSSCVPVCVWTHAGYYVCVSCCFVDGCGPPSVESPKTSAAAKKRPQLPKPRGQLVVSRGKLSNTCLNLMLCACARMDTCRAPCVCLWLLCRQLWTSRCQSPKTVRKRPQLPTNVRSCQKRVGSWLFLVAL